MRRMAVGLLCCARNVRGHAVANPTIALTKSRRRIAFTKARTTPNRTRLQQGFSTGEMGFRGRVAGQQSWTLGQKRTLVECSRMDMDCICTFSDSMVRSMLVHHAKRKSSFSSLVIAAQCLPAAGAAIAASHLLPAADPPPSRSDRHSGIAQRP